MSKKLFVLLIIIGLAALTPGYTEEPEFDLPPKLERVILPYALYTSETGIVVGLAGSLSLHDNFNEKDKLTLLFSTQYTQKKQMVISLIPRYQTADNLFYLETDISYKNWPSEFYGVGINTSKEDPEKYVAKDFAFSLNLGKQVYRFWSLGYQFQYSNFEVKPDDDSPLLASNSIRGSSGGKVVGKGILLTRDKRNSRFFATRGEFYEAGGIIYSKTLGSDYDFKRISIDLRKYFPLTAKQSVSFQFFTGYHTKGVPFQEMFQLGDFLRSYQTARYIDRSIAIIRTEYRVFPWERKFSKRIGFVLFVETGSVFSEYSDWDHSDLKVSLGGGFRFRIVEGDGVLLRGDIGFSPGSYNLIFIAMEAF
jgi:outer membrane protein assembly factor BamA